VLGLEKALDILTGCRDKGLNVDSAQASESKFGGLMPLFSFSKQGFNPNRAFTHGFLIGRGCLISRHPVKVLLVKRTLDHAPVGAGCTFRLDRTAFTDFGGGAVNEGLVTLVDTRKGQALLLRANIRIP